MVKYKDQLIKLQFLVIFLIPLTPHIKITNFLQLDDLPVVIFLILFFVNIYIKNIQKFYFKEVTPLIFFILYISIQNIILNLYRILRVAKKDLWSGQNIILEIKF